MVETDTGPQITAVVIRGDFTPAEFGAIVEVARRLDRQRPDARFEVVAVDPTGTALETAERMLREALPPQPGRRTEITRLPRDAAPSSPRSGRGG